MPQLWTETFVSQYFWLLTILLTYYFFMATKVIPAISNTIKLRQQTEESKGDLNDPIKDNSISLFVDINKQDFNITTEQLNWDLIQSEWLINNPENNSIYLIENSLSQESLNKLNMEDEEDLTLEEFLQDEN